MCDSYGQVLDRFALQRLCADAGYICASNFASTFLSMLPGRVARIKASLGAMDSESALEAVLSLKISSSMAGAIEMEHLCWKLEARLRQGKRPNAGLLCPPFRRLEKALADLLVVGLEPSS